MKFILKLLAVFVVLLAVGALVAFLMIDRLARSAVERGSTIALGVPTSLESASIGFREGVFAMEGLNVANPEGFDAPHFLTLGAGRGAITLATLREDVVELPLLELSEIDLFLEREGGRSNYQVILDNLKRFESPDDPRPAEGGKRFVVRRIEVRGVDVHADMLPVGGELSRIDVRIDGITLTDVGSGDESGVELAEVAAILVKAIIAAVIEKGGELPGELLRELDQAVAGLGGIGQYGAERVGEALEGLGVEGLGEEVDRALEGVGKGLEGVLGGQRKD